MATIFSSKRGRDAHDVGYYGTAPNIERLSASSLVADDTAALPTLKTVEGETVRVCVPVTHTHVGASDLGPGFLFVTTNRVVWMDASRSQGLGFTYTHMPLFAVSRDQAVCDRPCLYFQLTPAVDESQLGMEDAEDGVASAAGATGTAKKSAMHSEIASLDLARVDEARIVPGDAGRLDEVYGMLCECAALHPDPDGGDDDAGLGGVVGMMMRMAADGDGDAYEEGLDEGEYDDEEYDGDADGMEEEPAASGGATSASALNPADLITSVDQLGSLSSTQQAALARWDALLTTADSAAASVAEEPAPGQVPAAGVVADKLGSQVSDGQFEDA